MNQEHNQWLARAPQEALSKKLAWLAWIITAVVIILVGLMRRPELRISLPAGVSLSFLPAFHAAVNSLAAVLLILALIAVKQGRIALHRKCIFGAMGLSVLFLLSYLTYHFTSADVRYGDVDFNGQLDRAEQAAVASSRPFYLALLISHIVLAGISLPLILFTFIAGWTNRFTAHRKLARWVFPLWLYVAVTGPICYWMLRPYYQ